MTEKVGYVYYIDDGVGIGKICVVGYSPIDSPMVGDYKVVEFPQSYLLPYTMSGTDWSKHYLALGDNGVAEIRSKDAVPMTALFDDPLTEIGLADMTTPLNIIFSGDGVVQWRCVGDQTVYPATAMIKLYLTVLHQPNVLYASTECPLQDIIDETETDIDLAGLPNKDFSVWAITPGPKMRLGWQIDASRG